MTLTLPERGILLADITIWSKPACVACHGTKRYLDKRGISYEEKQLLDDVEKFEEFRAAGFASAPIVESIHHETFAGYRPDYLDEIIESMSVAQAA